MIAPFYKFVAGKGEVYIKKTYSFPPPYPA